MLFVYKYFLFEWKAAKMKTRTFWKKGESAFFYWVLLTFLGKTGFSMFLFRCFGKFMQKNFLNISVKGKKHHGVFLWIYVYKFGNMWIANHKSQKRCVKKRYYSLILSKNGTKMNYHSGSIGLCFFTIYSFIF